MKQSLKKIAFGFLALTFPCLSWATVTQDTSVDGYTFNVTQKTAPTAVSLIGGNEAWTYVSTVNGSGEALAFKNSGTIADYSTIIAPDINVGNGNVWKITFNAPEGGVTGVKGVAFNVVMYDNSGNAQGTGCTRPVKFMIYTDGGGTAVKTSETISMTGTDSIGTATNGAVTIEFDEPIEITTSLTIKAERDATATNGTLGCFYGLSSFGVTSENTTPKTVTTWTAVVDGAAITLNTSESTDTLVMDEASADPVSILTINGDGKLTFADDGNAETANTLTATTTAINADTDVSGITASLGAVTIAEGKTLTAGADTFTSETNISTTLSGAGTLALDLGEGGEETLKANGASQFSGDVNVLSGNLTVTGDGGSGFLTGRTVNVLNGATVTIGSDGATGWSNDTSESILNVQEGGIVNFTTRNSFKSTLKLTGGTVNLNGGDTNNSNRSLDWMAGDALVVEALIGATVAEPTVSKITSSEGRWKIAIRNADMGINVAENAKLEVDAPFIPFGNAGVIKKGAGVLELKGSNTLAKQLTINAGTVVVTSNWAGNVVNNATLGGTGSIAGTLTLAADSTLDATAGALTVTGAVTIADGETVTVTVPSTAEAGYTVLTCTSVTNLDTANITVTGVDGMTVEANADGTALVLVESLEKPTATFSTTANETIAYSTIANGKPLAANQPLVITFNAEGQTFIFDNMVALAFDSITVNGEYAGTIQMGDSATAVTTTSTKLNTTVTFDADSNLTLGTVSGDGQLVVAENQTLTLSATNTYTGGTTIAENATLTITNADALGAGVITGEGTLACAANLLPTNKNGLTTGTAATADAEAIGWTGTVKFTGLVGTANGNPMWGLNPANYGNSASTIEFAETNAGWLSAGGTCDSAICVSGTLTFNNGYSSNGGYTFSGSLSGEGTIATSGAVTDVIQFTGNTSGFAGTITVEGGHCISFGAHTNNANDNGQLLIQSDKTANIAANKTWTATNGVHVYGTIGGSGTIGSALTLNDGATLDASAGALTVNGNVTIGATLNVTGVTISSKEGVKILTKSGVTAGAVEGVTVTVDGVADGYSLEWKNDGLYVKAAAYFTEANTFSNKQAAGTANLSGQWTLNGLTFTTSNATNAPTPGDDSKFKTGGTVGETNTILTPNINVGNGGTWTLAFASETARVVDSVSVDIVMFDGSGNAQGSNTERTLKLTLTDGTNVLGTYDQVLTGNESTSAVATATFTFDKPIITSQLQLKAERGSSTDGEHVKGCFYGISSFDVATYRYATAVTEGTLTEDAATTVLINPTAWATNDITCAAVYIGNETSLPEAPTTQPGKYNAEVFRCMNPEALTSWDITEATSTMDLIAFSQDASVELTMPEYSAARPGQTDVATVVYTTEKLGVAPMPFTMTDTSIAILYAADSTTAVDYASNSWWSVESAGEPTQGALNGKTPVLWLENGGIITLTSDATALAFHEETGEGVIRIPAGVTLTYAASGEPSVSNPAIPEGVVIELGGSLTMAGTLPSLKVISDSAVLGADEDDLTVNTVAAEAGMLLTVASGNVTLTDTPMTLAVTADGGNLALAGTSSALASLTVVGASDVTVTAPTFGVTGELDLAEADDATLAFMGENLVTVGSVTWPTTGSVNVMTATTGAFLAYTGVAPETVPTVTGLENGCIGVSVADGTTTLSVVQVTPPEVTVDGNLTEADVQAATQVIANYLAANGGVSTQITSITNPEVAAIFEDVAVVVEDGVATCECDFGISSMSVNAAGQVVITAQVASNGTEPKVAQGVTLEFYCEVPSETEGADPVRVLIFKDTVETAGRTISVNTEHTLTEIIKALPTLSTSGSASLKFTVKATTVPSGDTPVDESIQIQQ